MKAKTMTAEYFELEQRALSQKRKAKIIFPVGGIDILP
jgi:hypothetical protein